MPKLSIIIVVYNLEKYVRECLDSVLKQELEDYEIVLVDNNSNDSSRDICREYEKKYAQIRFFPLEGENVPGRGHSVGIAEAKGEYLHLLDGDDFVAEGCYKDIMWIINEKAPDIIMGSFISKPEAGAKHFKDATIDPGKINGRTYEEVVSYLMRLPNFHMPHWRYVCKKDIFIAEQEQSNEESVCALYSKINKISYHGDIVTTVKILCNANSIYYYDKPFYYYRLRNKGSISSNNCFGHYRGYFLVIYRLINILRELKYDAIRQELIFYVIRNTFQLFSSGIGLIDYNGISEIAEIINDNPDYLDTLKKIKDEDIGKFCKYIETQGPHNGIKKYFDYKIEKVKSFVINKKGTKFFIFPSGRYGEFVARTLIENGIEIEGFIDNDSQKHGTEIMGLNCFLPEILNSNYKTENLHILISTIYNALKPVLKQQLINIGVPEEQITIEE